MGSIDMPTRLNDAELIPVIEINRFVFPSDTTAALVRPQSDAECQQSWLHSLASAGLEGLESVGPRSSHVDLRTVRAEHLDRYLPLLLRPYDVEFTNLTDPDAIEDLVSPLCGGLAIRSLSHGVLIEPQCCSDLSDFANWVPVPSLPAGDTVVVWIGHPELRVSADEDSLIFDDFDEVNERSRFRSVPRSVFAEQFVDAAAALNPFVEVVYRSVSKQLPAALARKLATTLVGLD